MLPLTYLKHRKVAKYAMDARSTWLSNMSHEMRTPLNAIVGLSELIILRIAGDLDHQYVEYANDIHRSGCHLLRVIADMLALVSLETGARAMVSQPVSLLEIIASCVRELEPVMQLHGTIVSITPIGERTAILGDRDELREVFSALLSHALNFGMPGEAINIALTRNSSSGVKVEIAYRGTEMNENATSQLLLSLEQGNAMVAHSYVGTGLGLSIIKKIVELHDGKLSLHRGIRQIATLVVELPEKRVVGSANDLP
jgi:signal transduction histidine kinase